MKSCRLKTAISCLLVWFCSAIIPVLFYHLECEYVYNKIVSLLFQMSMQKSCNRSCNCTLTSVSLTTIVRRWSCCNAWYIWATPVLLSFSFCICWYSACYGLFDIPTNTLLPLLSRQRSLVRNSSSTAQMNLLKQSFVVFLLYAVRGSTPFTNSPAVRLNSQKLE